MAAPLANPSSDRSPGGSGGGGWRALLKLTVPAICWEFLRRNPSYRADYEMAARGQSALDRRWGLSSPADPDLSSDTAHVLWRADVAPGLVVPMERASFGRPRPLPRSARAFAASEEGRPVRFPSGLQVLLQGDAAPSGPLMVVMRYDADFNLRVRAVDALRRASLTDAPPRSRLTSVQRQRLARSLYALDASLREQSYREIAAELFGEVEADDDFGTSSIRDVTIRLVRRGRVLMGGGYLKLLRAGF